LCAKLKAFPLGCWKKMELSLPRYFTQLDTAGLPPTRMPHQFHLRTTARRCILYLQEGWLCSLLFEIIAPLLGDAPMPNRFSAWIIYKLGTHILLIFEEAAKGTELQHLFLLHVLQNVAGDGSRFLRGW